ANNGSERFTTYASSTFTSASMLLPQIYKHVEICRAHEAGENWIVDGENHWHVCDTCGKVVGEKVAHTLTSVAEISSDCQTHGTAAHFKCEICNTLILEVESVKTVVTAEDLKLPLAAHTLGEWHAGTATCTEAGTIGYYQCGVCSKYFDIDGTTELESITGAAPLGHSFSAEWTSDGTNHWHKCIRCDATQDSAAHTFAFASDETQHWQVCSVCNHETAKENHTYVEGDCQCGATIKGTQAYPYTVAEALAEAAKLAQDEATSTKVYVVGTINSIGTVGSYLKNVMLEDTSAHGTEILLYTCNFTSEVTVVYVNDTVVVCGYLKNYNGTLEIVGISSDYATFESRTAGTSAITYSTDGNATVNAAESGINGETFSFTVTANSGYVVTTVTVNGSVVTPVDGTYSAIVEGPTTITVETTVLGGVVVSSWDLVTDASALQAGDQIVIASNSKGFVAGAISSQVMTNISATFAADKSTLTLPDGAVILTLGGSEGAWTLASPSGQLLGATAVKKL
ncbi:MAG: hypothetical protein ACI4QL_05330, partial [Candidatus Fimimonas sp.]